MPLIQPSFARGEVSESLLGRVDTAMYRVALAIARNAIAHAFGGVSNRPGLAYIGPCKDHANPPVMIPFRFKTTDTYMLEVGNLYMRIIRNDAHVTETDVVITAATAADPVEITTSTSHGYSNGDEVFISGVVGMTELNSRRFIVKNVASTTFDLYDQFDGGTVSIDGTSYTAYSSAGTVAKIYEITTPFAQADLLELKFTQTADVVTLTHPNYFPQKLSRTGHAAWTIGDKLFQPEQAKPTAITVTPVGSTGSTSWSYKVTAENAESLEESLTGTDNASSTPESATAANPVVVTDTGHPFLDGDEIEITGFSEMTEVNGRRFKVANKATNTYELEGEDGTGYDVEASGGTSRATFIAISNGNATLDGTNYNTIAWTAAADALRYKVYRYLNGRYGLIGETEETSFDDQDSTTDPDFDFTPPRLREPFRGTGNYPAAVGFYEQRQVFGGADNTPDTSDYTQPGNDTNLNTSNPGRAADAIRAVLTSSELNAIRHYVPLSDLVVLTAGEEWRVNSGQSTAGFSATTITQKPQTKWGSAHRKPITIGSTVLYVQDNDSTVRTIGYSFQVDAYTGSDLTVLAPHIFEDYTMVDWDFSRSPESLIHMVRSDGKAASLTFNEEQEVVAFTRWDTPNGLFKRVGVVRPNSDVPDDEAYFVVERVINGNTVLLIEKTHPRRFTDIRDAFFVDSGLSLDNPVTISGITSVYPVVVTTSAAHGFSDGDTVDIFDAQFATSFDAFYNEVDPKHLHGGRFLANDVTSTTFSLCEDTSDILISDITQANPGVVSTVVDHGLETGDVVMLNGVQGMTEANNNAYTITVLTDDTFSIGVDSSAFTAYTAGGTVHNATDGSAFSTYRTGGKVYLAVDEITGLWHLEGESVVALGDGNVIEDLTVTNGAISLDPKRSRVHVGLRYIFDFQTLNLEAFGAQGTMQGALKHIYQTVVRLYRTRGLMIGPDFTDMNEMLQREDEAMGDPTALFSGDKEIPMPPDWNTRGRISIRQHNPLPVTVLAVIPKFEMEGYE